MAQLNGANVSTNMQPALKRGAPRRFHRSRDGRPTPRHVPPAVRPRGGKANHLATRLTHFAGVDVVVGAVPLAALRVVVAQLDQRAAGADESALTQTVRQAFAGATLVSGTNALTESIVWKAGQAIAFRADARTGLAL